MRGRHRPFVYFWRMKKELKRLKGGGLSYSTIPNLPEKDKCEILEFTITVSSSQLNQYRYSKQKKIVTELMTTSMKLITI